MHIIIVSGGFDPLHSGHISYLESSKKLGDKLFVALNSDKWLEKKKGRHFMPFNERKIILENLEVVDKVIDFEDDEHGSCINALKKVKNLYTDSKITFANGGDRNALNIPEMNVEGILFEFGIGGTDKLNSSSDILRSYFYGMEERIWGKFFNLFRDKNVLVKEIVVSPNKGMSFQRHFGRSEIWFISKGSCEVNYSNNSPDKTKKVKLNLHDHFFVPMKSWHQIINPNDIPCHIIEIQYGSEINENDIERLSYYEAKNK